MAFTAALLLLLLVQYEFSFNQFHKNKNKLYQVYNFTNNSQTDEDNMSPSFGYPAAPTFKAEAGNIEKICRLRWYGNLAEYNEKEIEASIYLTDEDFFSMFTFPVITGNKNRPLAGLDNVVLTKSAAKKIFGNEEAVGKPVSLWIGSTKKQFTVSAVTEDFPDNSGIKFDILVRIENAPDYADMKDKWNNQHHIVFALLKKGATQQQAEDQLRFIDKKYFAESLINLAKEGVKPDKKGDLMATRLMPLSEWHFTDGFGNEGSTSKYYLYTLLAVALLIVVIACFNFINIKLVTSFTRAKEIGIRKCMGAARGNLFGQLWGESFLFNLISFMLAFLFMLVLLPPFNTLMATQLKMALLITPSFLLLCFFVLAGVALLAGAYPAFVMAKQQVVETLKGRVTLKKRSGLRSVLIVTQFAIAALLICTTLFIYRQFSFMRTKNTGFNRDYVISVPLNKPSQSRETIVKLRQRLAANTNIVSITGSAVNIGLGKDNSSSKWGNGFEYEGKQVNTNIAAVDYDFLKTLGIKASEGRDFNTAFGADSMNNVIITQSFAAQLGGNNLLGKTLWPDSAMPKWNIIGIVPDFHLYSLHEKVEPLTLLMTKNIPLSYAFIKVNAGNAVTAMAMVESEMKLLEPGKEFKGSFIDENIANWYNKEKRLSKLFGIAAAIAIVLCCLGLLALVMLMLQQRVKEIGVRKVLGAGVQNITWLISKEFLWLTAIALTIAIPIAWYCINKWLLNFPYRVNIDWWVFATVAVLIIVIALLTVGINAVRAAMQNPVKSLRTE